MSDEKPETGASGSENPVEGVEKPFRPEGVGPEAPVDRTPNRHVAPEGTPAPAAEQKLPLNVTWVNLTTGRSGSATLKPNPAINPEGPTTLTAIVDTGSGSIMSTIFGQVTTLDKQCTFMPTIGSSVVP